jgi:hypothetical protein
MEIGTGNRGAGTNALVALVLSGCFLGSALSQQAPGGQSRFASAVGGYIVDYPSDWHTFPPGNLPTLDIYNFPFSRAGGGVLPDGGASIALVPAPAQITTVEE